MAKNYIDVPGRLHVVTTKGQLAGADEIFDDSQGISQQEKNAEIDNSIETLDTAVSSETARAKAKESDLDGRVSTVESLAELSVEGGTIGLVINPEDIVSGGEGVTTANAVHGFFKHVTEEEYEALTTAEKNNGCWYFIEEE